MSTEIPGNEPPSEFLFKECFIAFIIFQNLINSFVEIRQIYRWRKKEVIQLELEILEMNQTSYLQHKSYMCEHLSFKIFISLFTTLIECSLFYMEFGAFMWGQSATVLDNIGFSKDSEYLRGLFCLGVDFIKEKIITCVSEYYENFKIKAKYDLNKKTFFQFIEEELFLIISSSVMSIIAYGLYLWFIKKVKKYFFSLYDILFLSVCIGFIFFYRFVLTMLPPLSQKFTELGKGQTHLKKKIINLCNKLKFPLEKIYVIDDTHRSYVTKPYYYGLKKKNIVIFENLLKRVKDEEVEAMVSQVISFYFLGHIKFYIGFVILQFIILYYSFAFFVCSESLVVSFGYKEYSVFFGSSLFLTFYTNVIYFINTANVFLGRSCEKDSDMFAIRHKYGECLISGVMKAEKDNMNNIDLDPLYKSLNVPYISVSELKKLQEEFILSNNKKE